jgi:uncharacterized RDD family membrane protein YckC
VRNLPWQIDALASALDVENGHILKTHRVADLGSRFLAGLVDFIIRLPVLIGAGYAGYMWVPHLFSISQPDNIIIALLMIEIGYFAFFELLTRGQTPGKNACDLRVVSEDGSQPTARQLLVRNLARVVDWLPLFYLLGWTVSDRSQYRQRIGDRLAHTTVVFDASMRDLLGAAGVPESVYSTSEDGYLLESYVLRGDDLREGVAGPLAHQLAEYFHRKYSPESEALAALYSDRKYDLYLRRLYTEEKSSQQS